MSESVEFSEEKNEFRSPTVLGQERRPKMVELLIKIGVAKNDKVAGLILLFVTIGALVASGIVFYNAFKEPASVSYEDLSELEKRQIPEPIRQKIEENNRK